METGLVLTGGGARGAYQAGVMRGVAQIVRETRLPFSVVTGVSAGAINGSFLAASFDDFENGTRRLCDLWENLTFDDVVKANPSTLLKTGSLWIWQTALGSIADGKAVNHLMDTRPLEKLIRNGIPFDRIQNAIADSQLKGVAISTTNYRTGTEIIFYESSASIKDWVRANRISRMVKIGTEHVLASAAIPVFFPPVQIENSYFGDGSIRSKSPLSPAIHLGAEKIFAVGVRKKKPKDQLIELNQGEMKSVRIADVIGTLLNGLFLDSLEADLERLERINRTVRAQTEESPDQLRSIQCLSISPSEDLGKLAEGSIKRFPKGMRYLFSGLGSQSTRGLELLSYMAFEKKYTSTLVQVGMEDAKKNKDAILEFFHSKGGKKVEER